MLDNISISFMYMCLMSLKYCALNCGCRVDDYILGFNIRRGETIGEFRYSWNVTDVNGFIWDERNHQSLNINETGPLFVVVDVLRV